MDLTPPPRLEFAHWARRRPGAEEVLSMETLQSDARLVDEWQALLGASVGSVAVGRSGKSGIGAPHNCKVG